MSSHERRSQYSALFKNIIKRTHISPDRIEGAAIASVVPSLNDTFKNIFETTIHRKPLFIHNRLKMNIKLATDHPSEVGADRIVNACAAYSLFAKKSIVIDFGTATTFDCVSDRGEYIGGAICPGPKLAAKSLADHTAKLPYVGLKAPRQAIGKNTVECIQSGLFFGYIGLIREINKRIQAEMGKGVVVIATGGDSNLMAPFLPEIDKIVPDLTLKGIKIVWEQNRT